MEKEILLTTLAYGGDAMGRLDDGRAVFVPFGLPGERVRVHLTEDKRNFARGEIAEILDPSPKRIEARCIHFGTCGGCHYQHLPYEEQLKAKTEILRDQLTRIGKIENPPVQEIVPSSSPWNYRNHVQFHLTEEGKLGYVMAQTPRVFAIRECHLPEGSINSFWPQLEFESETALERISLRSGVHEELMRSEEHTSELQSRVDISYAVFCLKKNIRDLEPVASSTRSPLVAVVNPACPVRTIPELVADAKAKPGKLFFF